MERRELTKADLDKVRDIEGFPIGTDEDIIALSDAPYYTACPNPFIGEFIAEHGHPYDPETDDYHREPFAADVSEGKNDPIYNAHSYHTKVPYKAIMRYILHYTDPGDIVLDGFCGTGMTGVAAQMCGCPDAETKYKLEHEMQDIKWGARHAILSDLSPAATFIAYNYNVPHDPAAFEKEARRILEETEAELGWMYETNHTAEGPVKGLDGKQVKGRINYTVWSDVFICPNCGREIVFYDAAFDSKKDAVRDVFDCPHCHAAVKKRDCERALVSLFDDKIQETVNFSKSVPVLINYIYGGKRFEKRPDDNDLLLIQRISSQKIDVWFPSDRMAEGQETRRNDPNGFTHIHHFYTKRNLLYFGTLWSKGKDNPSIRILLQSINPTLCSKLVRYNLGHRGNGPLSGTLYMPSLIAESDIKKSLLGKMNDFQKLLNSINSFSENIISVSSLSNLVTTPNNAVDYIFTDPPFGGNLNYSELSYIWETWLKVKTNNKTEAIMSSYQKKGRLRFKFP